MIVIGVDPGLRGGIAMLTKQQIAVGVVPMAIIRAAGKGRDQYDVPTIVGLFSAAKRKQPTTVYIERLQPLPASIAKGVIANYNRGAALWLFIGICSALEIPYVLVSPRVWQREMLAGTPGSDTKQRSILAAQRLFPGVLLLPTERSRKPSDGLSDALLIAEYGRRRSARVWDGEDELERCGGSVSVHRRRAPGAGLWLLPVSHVQRASARQMQVV